MKYWWVNANQTYEHTLAGGFLWSPKIKKNGVRNEFYDTMARVRPGDVIFVFRNMFITALGVATSQGYSAERPASGFEFNDWNRDGWRVDVDLYPLKHQIRPRDHMQFLAPVLPARYSPLRENGDGLQSVYLASVPPRMAATLGALVGAEYEDISGQPPTPLPETPLASPSMEALLVKDREPIGQEPPSITADREEVVDSSNEDPHDAAAIVSTQGPFAEWVTDEVPTLFDELDVVRMAYGRAEQGVLRSLLVRDVTVAACALCGMTYPVGLLVAAHIKPRASCTDQEKRDLPAIAMLACRFGCDELYERGYIGVAANGEILTAPPKQLTGDLEIRLSEYDNLRCAIIGVTNEEYFRWHREHVFSNR